MAMLSFEDAWKAVVPAPHSSAPAPISGRASMSHAQMLSQCFSKTFSTMQEIIHKVSTVHLPLLLL